MKETIFWWVFTLACVFAFFFGYGMVGADIKSRTSEFEYRLMRLTPQVVDEV